MRIEILESARDDLRLGHAFYEQQRPGLGNYFLDWKRTLAYITGTVDKELLLRNEYPLAENRILRQHLRGRLRMTIPQRKAPAEIAKRLSAPAAPQPSP